MSEFSDFYNKEITIMIEAEGNLDDAGIYHEGSLEPLKTIVCDVQPYSKDLAYKDYGYIIDCTKRVFCDIDEDIQIGIIVQFKDELYKIIKIVEWDDYFILLLDSYKGGAING